MYGNNKQQTRGNEVNNEYRLRNLYAASALLANGATYLRNEVTDVGVMVFVLADPDNTLATVERAYRDHQLQVNARKLVDCLMFLRDILNTYRRGQ